MNVVLWVFHGLLAAGYLFAGITKATQPLDQLSKMMTWVTSVPKGLVRGIGVVEIFGAIGLILPLATGIAPWLTIAAAVGLAIIQVAATVFHISRNESSRLAANVVFFLLAVVIIIGRVAWVPVA